jgi:hypothetical protein
MPTFVSLGCDCEVAHQIRRLTGDGAAFMFDWLITPIEACAVLCSDAADWLQPGNWELADEGRRVRDKATGLEFQHEFETVAPEDPMIDVSKVEGHLAVARAKFRHLKQKTLDAIASTEELYLVRKEWWVDAAGAAASAAAIVDTYSRLSPNVRVVVVSTVAHAEQVGERHLFLKIDPGAEWTGDDASWDRVFALAAAWREGFRA